MIDLMYAVSGVADPVPSDKEWAREIGRRLELTRRALGYDSRNGQTKFLKALATVKSFTLQRWNNYERGRQRPPPEVAMALHGKWGISPDWVYLGERGGLPQRIVTAIERVEASDLEGPIQ